jgi:solute carrier family 35 protein E1
MHFREPLAFRCGRQPTFVLPGCPGAIFARRRVALPRSLCLPVCARALCLFLLAQYNTGALQAAGGKHAGLTMTISTMQLGVCTVYAFVMWIVGWNPITLCGLKLPEKQKVPAITSGDFFKTIPVGFCSAAAHSSSVFALGGDPLFGQIVKAGEPVLSAAVGLLYGKAPSVTKAMCLPVIVGGVAFASLKKGADGAYALKFDMTALTFGMIANAFAAIKGSENDKLMKGGA